MDIVEWNGKRLGGEYAEMTKAEFEEIRGDKDTPEFIKVIELSENQHTKTGWTIK